MEKITALLLSVFLSAKLHSVWLITVAVADKKFDISSST
jgi:hypothetical protein